MSLVSRSLSMSGRPGALRALELLLLLLGAGFFFLHGLHLRADFPNHSPWRDWAKYTDEGWYGDAAIRHYSRGDWYVRGDFNPAAALPVWPLLEGLLFRFTGVDVVAARALTVAVFGLTLVAVVLLLRRFRRPGPGVALAPAAAVVLLAVSPFCYAFTRIAILEPLLVLLMLLSLYATSFARPLSRSAGEPWWRRYGPALALAPLLPAMVLTKTTAVFLLPAIGWMLWARLRYRLRDLLKLGSVAGAVGGALWLLYFAALVRPHYLDDYRYLFSANGYTGITLANALEVIEETVRDGAWIGPVLFPLALASATVAVLWWTRFVRHPLVMSLLLWAGGYAAFLAYHANLQPRYYLLIAVPLTLLIPVVLESLWNAAGGRSWMRALVLAAAAVVALNAVRDAQQTLHYVRTPEYTLVNAAEGINSIIRGAKGHNPLLLSISGSEISLMTGLPSICDDFGTMDLEERINTYRPGWYASWNVVEDDKMDALAPAFHLERVAAFPAMDDPDRNLLILYRVEPGASARSSKRRGRRAVPAPLRTRMGQQPSAEQLGH